MATTATANQYTMRLGAIAHRQVRPEVQAKFQQGHSLFPALRDALSKLLSLYSESENEVVTGQEISSSTGEFRIAFKSTGCFAGRVPRDAVFLSYAADPSLTLQWKANPDDMGEGGLERLASHFSRLLELLPEARSLAADDLMTVDERAQILHEWNQTGTEYPRDASLTRLFEQQAAATPNVIAIVHESRSITYESLNEQANQFARYLQSLGVGRGSAVGILLDRSIEMVTAMLAVMKAGACYLPLDSADPVERIRMLAADAQLAVVISMDQQAGRIPGTREVLLTRDHDAISALPTVNLPMAASAEDAAYIMYTSGSTGVPKGVEVVHRGIVRLVRNTNYIEFTPDDVVIQGAHASFDAITFEVWGALLNGSRLAIIPTAVLTAPQALYSALRKHAATVLFLTPALFNAIAAARPDCFATVQSLVLGGDRLDVTVLRRVSQAGPPARIVNGYGPTECTTFSTAFTYSNASKASTVPIGKPISNSQAYVLDSARRPVPVAVAGDLYLGGDGLASGYRNSPALTADRFVPNPFDPKSGARMYKTGDRACFLPDGNIEFLGRVDFQVKIRGFRVELGEIETALRQYPSVTDCVVIVRETPLKDKFLAAYVVATPATQDQVKNHLAACLPAHMVPSAIVMLSALPLTSNGKVNRAALPEPRINTGNHKLDNATELEREVSRIWQGLLGLETVGLDENLFDLGGNSILAVRLESAVRPLACNGLTTADIFQFPTVRSLAKHLSGTMNSDFKLNEAKARAEKQRAIFQRGRQSSRR